MQTEEIEKVAVPTKSKGQIFKEDHGYSKSLQRTMKKHGLNPNLDPEAFKKYSILRKNRKKQLDLGRQKKHREALSKRGDKSKTKKVKEVVKDKKKRFS